MARALYRVIGHELGLKVISFVVAAGLWFYVINTEDPIRTDTYERAVEPINVPSGLEVVKIQPERVSVKVRGRLSALDRSRFGGLKIKADLSGGKEERNQAILSLVGLPDRVVVEELTRPTVQVWIDRRVSKRIKIEADIRGKPADGFELMESAATVIEPAEVEVSGPAGAVDRVTRAVVRVDVSGFSENKAAERPVEAQDDRRLSVGTVKLKPDVVTVRLPIEQVTTRWIRVQPTLGPAPEGFMITNIDVRPPHVRLKGTVTALRDVERVTTQRMSIASVRTTRESEVKLVLPPGARMLDGEPKVSVRVSVQPIPIVQPDESSEEPEAESGTKRPPSSGSGADSEPAPGGKDSPPGTEPPEEPETGPTGSARPGRSTPDESDEKTLTSPSGR